MRFRRALDRGNVTDALSSASELEHVGLAEALELCLLIADKEPQRFGRAAVRWHGRFCREAQVDLEEAQAVLAALALLAGERKRNAAFALADAATLKGRWERGYREILPLLERVQLAGQGGKEDGAPPAGPRH